LIDFQRNGLKLKIRHFVISATATAVGTATATATANITTPTRLDVHHTAPPTQWMDWFRKDWTDELLAQLGSTPFERWYRAVTRFLSLTALATPFLLLYPFAAYSNTLQQYHWQYALWGLEQAGPTFVKLVQWATTRHDLFSPEFCSYFGTLRDTTKGHSWAETIQQLPPNFLQHVALEPTPIGSGCIAQVYKGHLLHSHSEQYPVGTPLAIKVQHPGILYKVCVDFYIMAKVAQWLEALPYLNLQYLSLVDTVTQFRDIMLPQLDLTLEAQHLQRFQHNFHSNPRVSFPTPLMDYTTKHVLTETFVHGTPILEFTNETKYSEKVRQQVALLGLETTLKMIFLDDFLHGGACACACVDWKRKQSVGSLTHILTHSLIHSLTYIHTDLSTQTCTRGTYWSVGTKKHNNPICIYSIVGLSWKWDQNNT
jgi:aarF domain-containing kinase